MEIPYEVKPRKDTGLYNSKLGIWLFLASEVMLFGGLFSAYVMLRVGVEDGVDNPWPWGLNVHKKFVWLGFTNTLVLISSSIAVIFAWIALKEKKWKKFQIYMYYVVFCALVFMCIKGIEYNSKLNKHHGVKLIDNSVIEGKILNKSDKIKFEVSKLYVPFRFGFPSVLKDLQNVENFPELIVEGEKDSKGNPIKLNSFKEFKKWFFIKRKSISKSMHKEKVRYREEKVSGKQSVKAVTVPRGAFLISSKPFEMKVNYLKTTNHTKDNVNYKDGSKVLGKLISDAVLFELHEIDMQLVLPQKQSNSEVWNVIGDKKAKEEFFRKRLKAYKEMAHYYEKRNKPIPNKIQRGYFINLHKIHLGSHNDSHHKGNDKGDRENEKYKHVKNNLSKDKKDEVILIPREKIKFMSNHGPRYGNYYAIYFAMTALHGLHVIGGALVLLYFVVFGKKMFDKDPDHLANRVEVGGLFWHFVDLIWIFLFPLMYLL